MQCREYIVKEGDTLYSLARKTGTTVEELLELNRGIEPTKLIVGSVMCLPRGGAVLRDPDQDMPMPQRPTEMRNEYIIKPGDTLFSIAKQFGVSVEQLLFANPDLNPGYIEAGDVIVIPKKDVPIPGSVKYIVLTGEELTDILRKFDIGYGRLKLFNPDIDLTRLEAGAVIFVPEVYGGGGRCEIGSYSYTVAEGDTFDTIAAKFNLTTEQLRRMNVVGETGTIRPGTVICLPLNSFDDNM